MKKLLPVLLPIVLILGFAATAVPQEGPGDGTQYLFVPDDWTELGAGSSAKVYYCTAKGSWGGSCADCVTTSRGAKVCGNVYVNASCQCDGYCRTSGSCTYQP